MKRARTSGMAEKAMEERRRSFTVGGEVRITLFNFRQCNMNRVKMGRTSGKSKKALEDWWRSFTIGSEVRILPFNFRQCKMNRSTILITQSLLHMKSIGTFFPLYFQVVLKPQYVLFDFLSLASDLSEINLHFSGPSKIKKGLYCAFRNLRSNFTITCFKK